MRNADTREANVSIRSENKKSPEKSRASELGPHSVKSVEKAFAVLEAFRNEDRSLSLSEIAALTDLDKSAVQRFTRTLRQLGYLEQDPHTRRYAIGIRVLGLSFSFLHANAHVMRAAPVLVNLRNTTKERVDMSLIDDESLVYVFRLQSRQEPLKAALVGRRVPIVGTAGGRAVLSRLSDEEAMAIVARARRTARTPRTLTDPAQIMDQVRVARAQGFAIQTEEWRAGEIVAAAALMDRGGRPVGAVHIAASTNDWDPQDFAHRMGPLVASAAQDAGE